ncbi:CoA-binding domain protein [Nitrosococcus halophilus Nc 4]|uniref:CoA-binding domain protein n=1 Tax=Nitrosococcus halophilus (strain Nc4) TaxID=472759 RepID=D5C4D5_NITHN|nr:bifunctional acetate--CoA ligase family protein/GNAT family N-acetyltransferase [Nitrosococcus halophilus]ADE15119.1 CoA-binding domain protein [Nitrosococcus halophilus Nc 4]
MTTHFLHSLFEPQSVAVFGASDRPNSVGMTVFKNMLEAGFQGEIHAINPKRETVQGKPAYPSLEALGKPIDLAVITTPATTVPDIIEACGKHGVGAAIIISAGFREMGPMGRELEEKLLFQAQNYGVRLLGPNCLGIMRPPLGLNATFNKGMALPGKLALVSQSGALCTAILDWATYNKIGFSSVISTGISADLDFGEILDYLVLDHHTESILLYIEGIHHARGFMSALRAAARVKPVIAVKVGRHAGGSQAAASHTGALVGADDVFDAALRRAGVVRATTVVQLFSIARTLASGYRTRGNQLAIITNGGGPGVLAADRAEDLGIPLARLTPSTTEKLNKALPPTWSHANPVDVIGDASAERYREAITLCLQDDHVDTLLVILTPQAMTHPQEVAETLIKLASEDRSKPILACWMGETQVAYAREAFSKAQIPWFQTPEAAVEAFAFLAEYHRNQLQLLQTPGPLSRRELPDASGAQLIIENALAEHRKELSTMEARAVLRAFRIPVATCMMARSPNEALVLAQEIGYPVAMKIASAQITHKSDVDGVRLHLDNGQAVRRAYQDLINSVKNHRPDAPIEGVTIEPMCIKPNGRELMIGIIRDPIFGPAITFGAGGTTVEILSDRVVALPPLNRSLVQSMIAGTRISRLLGPFRNLPATNMEAIEQILLRVSEMVCELPWLKEMDINPLIVDECDAVAVDARITFDYPPPAMTPYAHMAIHPYPHHLVQRWQLPDGTEIMIRPIRPEDAEIEQRFVRGLSAEARMFRFMQALKELPPALLARFTQIDYDREMALIVVTEQEEEVAVARYITHPNGTSCEFALVVADAWQHKGIAHRLMEALMDVARERGLEIMEGDVLENNYRMLSLCRSLHFTIAPHPEDPALMRVYRRL